MPWAGGAEAGAGRIVVPGLDLELESWRDGRVRVVGVDECGIGSLAGPVVAAAVLLPPFCAPISGVRDSKTLSRAQREDLFPLILGQATWFGLGAASPSEIERLNVRRASWLAMRRALSRGPDYDQVLIDGLPIKDESFGPHRAIVNGDATSYAIASASIVAKVVRDRLMVRLHRRHPAYDWASNAGYGSPKHLEALHRFGVTPYHRLGYAPVRAVLETDTV